MTVSDNLPVPAQKMGGAIVQVLGWEQHLVLPASVQYAIGRAIVDNPRLNTEPRVDMIADMASHHGENVDRQLAELFGEYPVETVYAAIDFLYEVARRDRKGGERDELQKTVELMDKLQKLGFDCTDLIVTSSLVDQLGGLVSAWEMSEEDIHWVLSGYESGN